MELVWLEMNKIKQEQQGLIFKALIPFPLLFGAIFQTKMLKEEKIKGLKIFTQSLSHFSQWGTPRRNLLPLQGVGLRQKTFL